MTFSLTPECQCPSHHPEPHLCYGGLDDIQPDTRAVGVALLQGQHHHLTLLRHQEDIGIGHRAALDW